LIDALLVQEYDRDQFELIFVEQRTKEVADAYNHKLGLKSLWDSYEEVKDRMNIQVVYLGDALSITYHLGRCNNSGIELAKGETISIMDGDMLLPPDFLNQLEEYHRSGAGVVNIARRMAREPVGVPFERWTEGIIDFDRCLEVCDDAHFPLPRTVENKGPMISAHRSAWKAINGYDEHVIWSTSLSRLGQDATARLEMFCQVESTALPDCFAVHPYHPAGFSRRTLDSVRLLSIQADLIDWARKHNAISWKERTAVVIEVYERNKRFVERLHADRLSGPDKRKWLNSSRLGSSVWLGRLYAGMRKICSKLPISWRLRGLNAGNR
jgi:hypothetical protein